MVRNNSVQMGNYLNYRNSNFCLSDKSIQETTNTKMTFYLFFMKIFNQI